MNNLSRVLCQSIVGLALAFSLGAPVVALAETEYSHPTEGGTIDDGGDNGGGNAGGDGGAGGTYGGSNSSGAGGALGTPSNPYIFAPSSISGFREPMGQWLPAGYTQMGSPQNVGLHGGAFEGDGNPSGAQKAEPASTGNSAPSDCRGGNPSTNNPVILATGEKFKVEDDIVASGPYGLSLTRTYKSFSTSGRMFGSRWLSTFDYPRLLTSGCYRHPDYPGKCMPTAIVWGLPDGSLYTYTANANYDFTFHVANSSALGTLSYNPYTGYLLTTSAAVYRYSTAGTIQYIKTLGGALVLQFTYAANSQLPSRVSNAAGQYIAFTYNPDFYVANATDQAGNVWAYQYTNVNQLTTVTSPGIAPDIRTYYYEAPSIDYTLLTGVAINGVRYSTYKYYGDKRVQESGLTGGEQRDTFTYGSGSTTVVNAQGQSTTYQFTPAQGGMKIWSISRAASATCPSASATTVYDLNGWVAYTLDWNGNRTNYTYDAAGKLLKMTVGAGTPLARTRVNNWTGENVTLSYWDDTTSHAYKQVAYTYVPNGFGLNNLASETWTDLATGATRQITYGYTFQANGMLASATVTRALSGDTATTIYNYDALGNLASVINPLGQQITYSSYNPLGFPGRITDPNSAATDFVYDVKSNLVSTIRYANGGSRTTNLYYNNARQVTDVAHADGRVDRARYNAALRAEYVGNALNEFTHIAYDVPSNTVSVSSARNVAGLNGSTPIAVAAG